MVNEPLICTVTTEGTHLVCTCANCGWVSALAVTGVECGALWDDHCARAHRTGADLGAGVAV
jgi:hypothetical protein